MENEIIEAEMIRESDIENELEASESEEVDEAVHKHELLCRVKEEVHRNFLSMAILLKVIRDKKLYEHLNYDSFDEYCSTPEIDLSRSQVYKLINVYETWIEEFGHKQEEIEMISIEKLYIAGSQAKQDDQEEWLEKARTLSRDDLKASTPGGKQRFQKVRCPHCGTEFNVNNDTKVN
jgi:hypothetical protein